MKQTIHHVRDADMIKVVAALKRAAARARKVAQQTNTPLVIYKDGRVIRMRVAHTKAKSSTALRRIRSSYGVANRAVK